MTTDLPAIDGEAIRAITGPKSPWAKQCGKRVEKRRADLRFSRAQVARGAGATEMTIFRIERGELVPRDYLRLALAMTLFCEVDDLWPAMTRQEISKALEEAS